MYNLIPTLLSTTGAGENTAAPVASAVTPATRYTGGGQIVTIQGTDLKNPTGVTIDGVSVTIVASGRYFVQVLTAAHAAGGPYDIEVKTSLGSDTISGALSFIDVPTAVLTSISPTYGPASGGTTITATGTFVSENLVFTVNGLACTSVTWVDANTATFVTPAQTDTTASYDVVVTMYGAANTDTLAAGFDALELPTVASVDVTAQPLVGGDTITITGTGFVSGSYGPSLATLGGSTDTATYVSATSMTFDSPALSVGSKDLTVTNAGGTSAPLAGAVTYYAVPTVVSSSVVPKTYALATVLTVSDSTSMTGGTLGGTALTGFSVLTGTTVACTFPGKSAGSHDLVLTGHPGGSTTAFPITVVNTNPVYTSVTPTSGVAAGGTALTIAGTGFSNGNATSVTIAGNACTSFTAVSDIEITCTSPAGTNGAVTILVVGPAGTSNAGTYTYSGFVPTDVTTLLAWWDPNTGATPSLWADQSGNGNDLEQTTGASQPTQNTADSDMDGNDCFQLDGSNDFFVTVADVTFGAFEIWIVKKSTGGQRLWLLRQVSPATDIAYGYQPGGPNGSWTDASARLSRVNATGYVQNPSTVHLHQHRYNGHADHVIGSNGTDYTMTTVADTGADTVARSGLFYLGAYVGTSEFLASKIGDIFIFSAPLSSGDRAAMYAFIKAKYPTLP